MASTGPQTISVKRKRDDVPVETLVVETSDTANKKRIKSESGHVLYRRRANNERKAPFPPGVKLGERLTQSQPVTPRHPSPIQRDGFSSGTATPRRFHLSRDTDKPILVERKAEISMTAATHAPVIPDAVDGAANSVAENEKSLAIRKLPGRGTALPARSNDQIAKQPSAETPQPSEAVLQMLEKLTEDVLKKESRPRVPSQIKSRFKPKAPALRYKERHPEAAEAMEIDDDDYVYDTYYREEVMSGVSESVAEPTGSVGVIVIDEEDEDLWEGFGEEEEDSDRVYTDDEDENAEDYYANDYPEDELDSEDEFDKNPYRYHHGSDEEEYDAANDPWSDEDEDKNARSRDDFEAALDDVTQFTKLHPAPQDRDHDMEVV